jgi:hypothetical protein
MPSSGIQLNKSHSALNQSPRDQAISSELSRFRIVQAIGRKRACGLTAQINGVGRLGLHAKRQLVTSGSRRQFSASRTRFQMFLIELCEQIELLALLCSRKSVPW